MRTMVSRTSRARFCLRFGVCFGNTGSRWPVRYQTSFCSRKRLCPLNNPSLGAQRALGLSFQSVLSLRPSAVSKDMLVERLQGFTSEVLMHPVHELGGR